MCIWEATNDLSPCGRTGLASPSILAQIDLKAETVWPAYVTGWTVKAGIHLRKALLSWTRSRFQLKAAFDLWTELTAMLPGTSSWQYDR